MKKLNNAEQIYLFGLDWSIDSSLKNIGTILPSKLEILNKFKIYSFTDFDEINNSEDHECWNEEYFIAYLEDEDEKILVDSGEYNYPKYVVKIRNPNMGENRRKIVNGKIVEGKIFKVKEAVIDDYKKILENFKGKKILFTNAMEDVTIRVHCTADLNAETVFFKMSDDTSEIGIWLSDIVTVKEAGGKVTIVTKNDNKFFIKAE